MESDSSTEERPAALRGGGGGGGRAGVVGGGCSTAGLRTGIHKHIVDTSSPHRHDVASMRRCEQ